MISAPQVSQLTHSTASKRNVSAETSDNEQDSKILPRFSGAHSLDKSIFFTTMMMKGIVPLLIVSSAAGADDKPDSWYKRYAQYPEYCSTPAEMETRRIPPLRDDDPHLGDTRLVHVTTVIRHGARTPWSSNQECWKGFWDSEETGIWNCDLTTILAPPTPNHIKEEEGDPQLEATNAMFLFEKKYDALADPKDGLTNELNGTCQLGQLLMQGYEQEIRNGQFLREAYLYDSKKYRHDERMRLLDISFAEYSPWDRANLHYRADDDQRTLMSGQVLLRGLFGPEVTKEFAATKVYPTIPVHTADRSRDILDANEQECPKLANLRHEAEQSKEYQKFNHSLTALGIRNFMATELGKTTNDELLDCLMTTMCTDRPLPEIVNDYGNTTSWFRTLSEFDIRLYTLLIKYNNAAYAKHAMAPLWAEIMENIHPILDPEEGEREWPPPKLAVFSAHDTTVMPLLASLGPNLWNDTDWPPYASMILIEIHEIIDGRADRTVYKTPFAFRLVYNGAVLTHLIPGCPPHADLCDVHVFIDIVDPMATRDLDCTGTEESKTYPVLHEAADILSTTFGILLFLSLVIISGIFGAMVTFVSLTGGLPSRSKFASIKLDEARRSALSNIERRNGYSDVPDGIVMA